jgi:hypothetical protein
MATEPTTAATPNVVVSAIHLHVAYIVMFVALALGSFYGFRTWETEHDARVVAEQQVKVDEVQVKSLQDQIIANDAKAQQQIAALSQLIKQVKTPAQVVANLPAVLPTPLPVPPFVNSDNSITFPAEDVLPLFDALVQGKEAEVNNAACQADLTAEKQIVQDKNAEIASLKKKPSFWKRIKHDAEVALFSAAVTAILIH